MLDHANPGNHVDLVDLCPLVVGELRPTESVVVTGVVDQDVDVTGSFGDTGGSGSRGQVTEDRSGIAAAGADTVGDGGGPCSVAPMHCHRSTLCGKHFGDCLSKPRARAGDQRPLAGQSHVHDQLRIYTRRLLISIQT